MAAPTPRVVPGAPPPKKANKKSKASGAKKQQQGQAPAPVTAAVAADTPKSAALLSSVPKPNQLPDSLKVHPQDLAEQAEKDAAIEAVKVLEANSKHDSQSGAEVGKSAVEAVISKKIKTLTKKIQRISGYETLEESKLNADQRRAISTKPALEMVVQELNDVIKAVTVAQKEDKAAEEQRSQERIAAAKQASQETSQSTLLLLVQFLHIFNLVHPNPAVEGASASFAPPSLPAALEQATGQEIAALAKVFDGLVNAPLSGSQETVDLLKNIEDDSQEEVLEGVTSPETAAEPSFLPDSSIPSTPPGLSAPSFHTAFGHSSSSPSRTPQFGETSPIVPVNIRFMQASEILDDELVDEGLGPLPEVSSAPAAEPEVTEALAEPEGGGVEEVPTQSLPDAQATTSEAAQRGAEGGKGSTMGGEVHSSALADASNVEEVVPAPTASSTDAPTTATPAKAPALRHLDWATEGDDTLDDLEFALPPLTSDGPGGFPSTSSMGLKAKPNLAPPVGGPQGTQAPLSSAGRSANGGGRRPQANGNAQGNGPRQPYVPPKKPQPEVDEDGFILLPSRRAQPQQQHQQRGRGRGGGGGAQRGDGRARGRGGQGGSGGQNRGGQGGGEGQAAGGRQRGEGGKNNTGGAGSAPKSSAPQARAPTQA